MAEYLRYSSMKAANPALAWCAAAGALACFAGCVEMPMSPQFASLAPAAAVAEETPKPELPKLQEPAPQSRPAQEQPEPIKAEAPRVVAAPIDTAALEQQAKKDEAVRLAGLRRQAAKVREQYVNAHAELLEDVRLAILNQQVLPGMSSETVFVSLGVPERVTKRVTSDGTSEQWAYPGRYLYFENGVLSNYTEEH